MRKKKKTDVLIIISRFLFPIILGFSVILLLGILLGNNTQIKYWSLITGYFFPPLGKETVIPAGIAIGFNPILMSLSIAFVDIVVALFLVWNYDLAKKIPFVEKFITKIESRGKSIEDKYGWIKPLRFIGIILFVMVPFQGSGGLVGSIVGRLIGMKPWNIFFAILIGAIVGTLLVAAFSKVFLEFAKINVLLTLALVAVIAITIIVHYLYKKRKNKKKSS